METVDLKYGDLISLKQRDNEQIMAIGFTEFKVYIQHREENKPCTNYQSYVFKVIPRLNYDVRKELQKKKKYYNKMNEDYKNFDDKQVNPEILLKKQNCNNKSAIKDKLNELLTEIDLQTKRTAVEEKLNDSYQASKEKTPVLQGESIQLVHFDSNQFLGAKKTMAADHDKSCTLVQLMESGSFQSIWKIMPSVNHKKQGDIVRYTESVLLINEFNGCYLHYSGSIDQKQQGVRVQELKRIKDMSPDRKAQYQSFYKLSEVNCSQNKKEWTLELYRRVEEDDMNQLRCGDTIRLKHTAQDGYVCADIYSSDLKELNEGSRACQLRIYKGIEKSEIMDTGSYFVLEKGQSLTEQSNSIEQGSIAKYCFGRETMNKQRLRHLISGRYIKMAEIDIIFKNKKKADKQERILGLSKIFEKNEEKENNDLKEFDEHTVFQFQSTSKEMLRPVKSRDQVKVKFFRVKSAGAVGNKMQLGVGNREIINSRNQMMELVAKRTKDLDLFNRIEDDIAGLDKRTILLTDQDKDENSFLIEHVNSWQVETVKQLVSAIGLIHYFVNNIKAGKKDMLSNWNDEIKLVLVQMKNVEWWIHGNYKREAKTDLLERQLLLQKISRDLRMIDLLVDIVYQPQEVYSELNYKNIQEKPVLMEIQKVAYSIIKSIFSNQRRNEFQAAQWIKLFIKQSLACDERNSINAEDTLASLIRSNKKLLDKYISEEIIDSLIDVQNKKKNVSLLSSLCVCKGEAVKSKQNKIIDLFIKSEEAFKQFFIRMDDITVRGKGKVVIECMGKVMKSQEFDQLKASIELVSALCYDRNQKSIEQFNSVQQFFNVFTNFIEKAEIPYDIKSKFVTLTQHLIFDKEPFKFNKLPVYTVDYPPVYMNDAEAEYSSSETVKLMKKFLNNFLNDKNQRTHYDQMMWSVMNIVFFMCSHKIQGRQEITVIVKTINDRIQDQISEACGLITRTDQEQLSDNREEATHSTQLTYSNIIWSFLKNLNTLWFDNTYDMTLFTSQNSMVSTSNKDNSHLNKIGSFITTLTPSLIKSLNIITQVNMSRINEAILKFLTKCNTKQLEIENDFQLSNQLLMQLGIMPQIQQNKIMREQLIMSKAASTLFDDNILKRIDTTMLLHQNLSDFTRQVEHKPRTILGTCSINEKDQNTRCDQFLKETCGLPNSEFQNQDKLLLPIIWIKEHVAENSIFDDDSNGDKENQVKFNELLISYICSDNQDLQISAQKLLIDSIFSIDNFVETLDNMQLIDSDDLKELHKKIDIIARTLLNKIDNLSESRSENFQELVIQIAKMFFFLSDYCLQDDTKQDNHSNTRTIDKTGAHNVESMFEELQAQGLLDNEIEMNKIEEDMMRILNRLQYPADREEIENWKKWRQFVYPLKQSMNAEIQWMFQNLKLHEIAFLQINQDVSDMDAKPRELIITLKCIAYRFLLMMSHQNLSILNNLSVQLPTIVHDLKNQLIACQLQTEVICSDYNMLKRLSTTDLSKICQLISSYDEDMDQEKGIALALLHNFVYQKNEVIKNNQNEIANMIGQDKGFNIIPHIFKKSADKGGDKIPPYYKEEISTNIVGQLEKQNEVQIKPFIMQSQEFIKLLCVLTEKTNFQTESHVKDLISFSKIVNLLELSQTQFDIQTKILQLIIDAFLDLEEVQDNTAVDFSAVSGLLKVILTIVNQIVNIHHDPNYEKQYVYELIPNGVRNKYSIREQANDFLYNQVIYLVALMFKTFGHKIQDNSDFKKLVEQLADIDAPDVMDQSLTLNQSILAIQIKTYSKNQSCKVVEWMGGVWSDGLRPPVKISKCVESLQTQIQEEDEYELMRDNFLAHRWDNFQKSTQFGKVNNFMQIVMSIVRCNIFYKMISQENLKNFTFQLQSQNLKFSNKRNFLKKMVQILIHNHNYIEKNQIIRGLKFLRMFIECQNVKCVNESIYWQTKDQITIEGEVSDSQDVLVEVGAAELIVKLISQFSDTDIISESVMLACALLLGGNERTQLAFLSLQDNKEQDGQMVKLFDLLNFSFRNIQNMEVGKLNNNKNMKKKLQAIIKSVPQVSNDVSKDEFDDSTSLIENQVCREFHKLDLDKHSIHEIDPTSSSFQQFKGSYLENTNTDQKEMIFRILKFLQNLCENHNNKLQEFVREQMVRGEVSGKSRNFITLLCIMFKQQLSFISKDMIYLGIQIVDTLVEFIQGPCKNNQIQVVKDKGLDTSRDVLQSMRKDSDMKARGFHSDDDQMYISILKYKTIVLVNSLFEGNKNDSDFKIQDEIPKSIEFNILTGRLVESFCNFIQKQVLKEEKREVMMKLEGKDQRFDWIFSSAELKESEIQLKTAWMSDYYLQEGFNISILMMNIADQNKSFQQEMQTGMSEDSVKRSFNFFKLNISNIDVCVFEEIWKVQFPIHPYCRQLSPVTKEEFFNTVDRETPMSKLNGLIEESKFLVYEMQLQYDFNQFQFQPTPNIVKVLGNVLLFIAFVQNLMFLFFPRKTSCVVDADCDAIFLPMGYETGEFTCQNSRVEQALVHQMTYSPQKYCIKPISSLFQQEYQIDLSRNNVFYYDLLTNFFGQIQILFSFIIFTVWYFNHSELIKQRQWEHHKEARQQDCDKILKAENIDQEKINDFQEKKIENLNDDFWRQKSVLYLKGPNSVEFVEGDRKQGRNQISMLLTLLKYQHDTMSLIQHSDFLQKITYFLMSVMGTFVTPFFFSFHLFDLVQRFNELKNILYAITKNSTMLLTTIMFTFIITYTFTLFGFLQLREGYSFFYPNDIDDWLFGRPKDFCLNIIVCILYNLNQGIRLTGAHTAEISITNANYWNHFFQDMGFVIIVPIILINIVFGIVIDSFGELYSSNNLLKNDIANVCFICELERDTLEKVGISFDQHIQYDHNWEFQLQFIVHLRNKDKAFFNGVELEISNMIEQKSVSFFPRKKMFDGADINEEDDNDDINLQAKKLLEITKTIKGDIKKISETMDTKINSNKYN